MNLHDIDMDKNHQQQDSDFNWNLYQIDFQSMLQEFLLYKLNSEVAEPIPNPINSSKLINLNCYQAIYFPKSVSLQSKDSYSYSSDLNSSMYSYWYSFAPYYHWNSPHWHSPYVLAILNTLKGSKIVYEDLDYVNYYLHS